MVCPSFRQSESEGIRGNQRESEGHKGLVCKGAFVALLFSLHGAANTEGLMFMAMRGFTSDTAAVRLFADVAITGTEPRAIRRHIFSLENDAEFGEPVRIDHGQPAPFTKHDDHI